MRFNRGILQVQFRGGSGIPSVTERSRPARPTRHARVHGRTVGYHVRRHVHHFAAVRVRTRPLAVHEPPEMLHGGVLD